MHPKIVQKRALEAAAAQVKGLAKVLEALERMEKTLTEVWERLDGLDLKIVALGRRHT